MNRTKLITRSHCYANVEYNNTVAYIKIYLKNNKLFEESKIIALHDQTIDKTTFAALEASLTTINSIIKDNSIE